MASLPIDPDDLSGVMASVEPQGMDDSELASLLAAHEASAVGYYNSEIAAEQARAIDYYYGRMDDLEVLDGCSSVTDHSVAVMVDNALAAVLKPFVSADQVVSFEPRGPEDVEVAEQATEYANYVINCDNPGFQIFHDWVKDGLLTKIGIVKYWWEDQSRVEAQPVPADASGVLVARQQPGYQGEREVAPGVFLVTINNVVPDGRVRIENVPPEEFLISPFARSLEYAPYIAHRPSNFTRSDLIEMGVDVEVANGLPAASSAVNEESRSQARYRDEDWSSNNQGLAVNTDRSRDVLDILDEYIRVDYDGDGVSELRRVVRVGDTILLNEPVDEAPFAGWCPCPMPHKVYGRALADQAIEGQKASTAILRQTLDNLYKTNNPRPVVGDRAINDATLDDLLDSSPGAIIRVADTGQFDTFGIPFMAQHSFPMLEYMARQTEERTGIQRKGNGLNAEALKKNSPDTATQAAIDENSRNERAEMIARIFAETGVKRLFRGVLRLLVRHQPRARIVRMRNRWVAMDPSGWPPEMDVSISVGLGVGNKAEQVAQAQTVLQTMAELQQTPFAYLLQPQNVHAAMQRLFTAAGIKNVDDFIGDPAQLPPPPEPSDPEMEKARARMQTDAIRLQGDMQKAAAEHRLKIQETIAKLRLEQVKAETNAQLDQAKAEFEAQLAAAKMAFEQQIAEKELAIDSDQHGLRSPDRSEAEMSENRPGGDLDK